MDLVAVTGGRTTVENIAHRDRLPAADDDPMTKFQEQYGLTKRQTVALIGGAHNFGAAHGKCSGYIGQWTPTPLDWFGPDSSEPTFFADLLQEDWRWYHVCTYENNTVSYTSIENPLTSGEEEEEEEEESLGASCGISRSQTPLICEDQAMRGCDFADGSYSIDESPCDIDLLQLRLRSDFFLKANPELLPYSKLFADDADLLAEEFGLAYHKMTHYGLKRCGLSGHGCAAGYTCKVMGDDPLTATCISESETRQSSSASVAGNEGNRRGLVILGVVTSCFFLIIIFLSVLILMKMTNLVDATTISDKKGHDSTESEDRSVLGSSMSA